MLFSIAPGWMSQLASLTARLREKASTQAEGRCDGGQSELKECIRRCGDTHTMQELDLFQPQECINLKASTRGKGHRSLDPHASGRMQTIESTFETKTEG